VKAPGALDVSGDTSRRALWRCGRAAASNGA
jgi:hypothetical protein